MKSVFDKIRQLAELYLDTRHNDIHTAISTSLTIQLLEKEGGDENIVIPAILLHDTGTSGRRLSFILKLLAPRPPSRS